MDDEVVGVHDEFGDERWRKGAVEPEGVPVLFAHVISRKNRLILIAKFDGAIWIALEIHPAFLVFESEGGEHLPQDFVNKNIGPKGIFLGDRRFGEQVAAAVIGGEGHLGILF